MEFLSSKVSEILQEYDICDACLGRQFSMLGTQTTNQQRGYALKLALTMQMHLEGQNLKVRLEDRHSTRLKTLHSIAISNPQGRCSAKLSAIEGGADSPSNESFQCYLCDNIFSQVNDIADIAVLRVNQIEFENFLVGTTIMPEISDREDEFRARFQLTHGEAFKSHLNREIGKLLQKRLDLPVEFKDPQLTLPCRIRFF